MNDYDERASRLAESWKDDVQHWNDGLLSTHVQPALGIYATDLLGGYQDRAGLAPILADVYVTPQFKDSVVGHYVGGLAAKLGTSGTSIHSALGAIDNRLDCHMVFAALRRAFEGMCKACWLLDPKCGRDEKVLRLASLVCQEVKETTNTWEVNPEIKARLEQARQQLITAIGKPIPYQRKLGQDVYQREYGSGAHSDFEWNIMCDMTHENLVFDSIMQRQAGNYQERMNLAQMEMAAFTIGMMADISTSVLQAAGRPDIEQHEVGAIMLPLYEEARQLVGLKRGPGDCVGNLGDTPSSAGEVNVSMADDTGYLDRVIHPPPSGAKPVSMTGLMKGAGMVGMSWQGASLLVVLGIMAADRVLAKHEGAMLSVDGFGGVIGPEQIVAGYRVWDQARSGSESSPRETRHMATEALNGPNSAAALEHIEWCDMLIKRAEAQ